MGHSLCSFILRQIPRRSPTHNAVYFTTTRLGGYTWDCSYRSVGAEEWSVGEQIKGHHDSAVVDGSHPPR